MKGKNLLILLVLVAVLGGAWYLLSKGNSASWSATGGGGGKVIEFPLNDVARINIKSPAGELNLVKKADVWTVQERADYPASFDQVSTLLRKLWELKTVQDVKVGPSQMPRLELVEPGKGDSAGTLVQLFGADGKPIQALLLGKKQMRKGDGGEDPFGGMGGGFATGRYVKPLAGDKVSLVSDPLEVVDPKPEGWLIKDYIKVESPKSVTVAGATEPQHWSVSRESATGEWKLADAKPDEKLDSAKVSALNSVFSSPSVSDVQAPDAKLEEPVTTATIVTFDGFQYELKIGKASGENYPVLVKVTGNFPKERTAAADEKPEDKTRLDGEFTTKQKSLEEKLANEKKYEGRPFLVAKFSVEPLLKDRGALLAEKPPEPAKPVEPTVPPVGQPVPPPVKPAAPPADKPAPPPADKPALPTDKPAPPPADKPAPPADKPEVPAEKPAAPAEKPAAPSGDKPAPPAPPADKPAAPAPESPAPSADKPVPPSDKPAPPADKPEAPPATPAAPAPDKPATPPSAPPANQ